MLPHAGNTRRVSLLALVSHGFHATLCRPVSLDMRHLDATRTSFVRFSGDGSRQYAAKDNNGHETRPNRTKYESASWFRPSEQLDLMGDALIKMNPNPVQQSWKDRSAAKVRDGFLPLSPEAIDLQASLLSGSVDPFTTLKQKIDKREASLESIRVCIDAARRKIFSLKRSQRPAFLSHAQHQVSAHVLMHIWSDSRIWAPILLHDAQTSMMLCYFAVAEGLDKYVESGSKSTSRKTKASIS